MGQKKNFPALYAGLTLAKIAALIAQETDSGEIVPATPDFPPTILRTPVRAPEASGSFRRAEAHEVRPRPVMAVELPPLKLNPEQYQRVTSGKVPVQVEYPPVKVKGPSFVLRSRKSQELKLQADAEIHAVKEKYTYYDQSVIDRDRSRSVTAPPLTEFTGSELDPADFEEEEVAPKGKGKGKAKEGKKK